MVLLDHLTRGRTMLGIGPGQLTSDAHMLGIPADAQRPRMEEALDAIMALFRGETVTRETDWFTLHDARLQLSPYSRAMLRHCRGRDRSRRPARGPPASTASGCCRSPPPRNRAWTCSVITGASGRRSRSSTATSPTARSGGSSARCTSRRPASGHARRSSTASRSSRATSRTCCPPDRCRATPSRDPRQQRDQRLRDHRHARRRRGAHRGAGGGVG